LYTSKILHEWTWKTISTMLSFHSPSYLPSFVFSTPLPCLSPFFHSPKKVNRNEKNCCIGNGKTTVLHYSFVFVDLVTVQYFDNNINITLKDYNFIILQVIFYDWHYLHNGNLNQGLCTCHALVAVKQEIENNKI